MRPEGPSQDRLRIAAVCEEAKKASVHPATAAIARCIAARTETETVSRHSLNCRPRRRAVESHVYMRINRGVSGIYAYIMIGGVFFFFSNQTKPDAREGRRTRTTARMRIHIRGLYRTRRVRVRRLAGGRPCGFDSVPRCMGDVCGWGRRIEKAPSLALAGA